MICSQATKILNKEHAQAPKAYDIYGNSLYASFQWGNHRNENVTCVFVDPRQKISADKSKQTSTFLEILNSNESSFKHLLPYLSLSNNGLLEMCLELLTFYLRNKNFYFNFPRQ